MKRRTLPGILALLFTLALWAGGLCAPAFAENDFSLDKRAWVSAGSGSQKLAFEPKISGVYDLYAFCGSGDPVSRALLLCDGAVVARGSGGGHLLSASLAAGKRYVLEIQLRWDCTLEWMRHMTGRSLLLPEVLDSDVTQGVILQPGNAQWYAFTAQSGRTGIYLSADGAGNVSLRGEIYDETGTRLVQSRYRGGAAYLYLEGEAGKTYYLRVYAAGTGVGKFRVRKKSFHGQAPEQLEILTGDMTLLEGAMRSVRARTEPRGNYGDMVWASSDESVATVSDAGVVTAQGPGEARITVYAYGGLSQSITVTVLPVVPRSISYPAGEITLRAGDAQTPELLVYPLAASDAEFTYASSNEEVATISQAGEITALAEGDAVVYARYGEMEAALQVHVEPAPTRYRALLIGEQMYQSGVNTVRTGSVNTVYNLQSLFETAQYEGESCPTRVEIDITAQELQAAVTEFFAGARECDVSIFYISCHGSARAGETVLQFSDGSELTGSQLERMLRAVPGTVVVLADFCDSGGVIGGEASLAQELVNVFAGGNAAFSGSKYKVLASAARGQDSYRLGYGDEEGQTATVFCRALCDGLGWNMEGQRRGSLSADADYSGQITLWEAYRYTLRRVKWYLALADGSTGKYQQDVQIYPEGDGLILFSR